MRSSAFDLYPPVTLPHFPPAWEDVERLALHSPAAYCAIAMVQRGDWTREQALIMLVFTLASTCQKLFSAEIERLNREIPRYIVLQTGDQETS